MVDRIRFFIDMVLRVFAWTRLYRQLNSPTFALPGQGELRSKGHLSHRCVASFDLESLGLRRRQLSSKPTNQTPIGANHVLCRADCPGQSKDFVCHPSKNRKIYKYSTLTKRPQAVAKNRRSLSWTELRRLGYARTDTTGFAEGRNLIPLP